MDIQARLKKEALALGAVYFGVADLRSAIGFPLLPYHEKLVAYFPRAISIGFPLSDYIVDCIKSQDDRFALQNYRSHAYDTVNPLINQITLRLGQSLAGEGFTYLTVPASQTVDQANHFAIFSHKIAANLSGLGWIGKNCLLITPDRGPRVRWGTILTNAPLTAGKPLEDKNCGECQVCVKFCPPSALTGKPFSRSEPREVRIDVHKCYQYVNEERKKAVGVSACGLCVYVCHLGNRGRTPAFSIT